MAANFNHRSYEKELLDGDDIPFAEIARNMKELNFINTFLGGHNITLKGLQKIFSSSQQKPTPHEPILICELGCGGGDNLNVIAEYCYAKQLNIKCIGIDINPDCIQYARQKTRIENADWLTSDYRNVIFEKKPDVIFSSLFCHHFNNQEMKEMLEWMKANAKLGFFINDLHRHPFAFYSIKWLTRIFSHSYLVKNDAPLSVLRGFTRSELENLLEVSGISRYSISWNWAFRWLITYRNIQK